MKTKTEIEVGDKESPEYSIETVIDYCIGLVRELKKGNFEYVSELGSAKRECFYLQIETTEGTEQVEFVGRVSQIEADTLLNSNVLYEREHTKCQNFRRASEDWTYKLKFVGGKYNGIEFEGEVIFSWIDEGGP